MNERQQAHIDYYLRRLGCCRGRKPAYSTARLLVARDADEAHPLRSEEEAAEVVEYLRRLELESSGEKGCQYRHGAGMQVRVRLVGSPL